MVGNKSMRRQPGQWWFLAAVVALYCFVAAVDVEAAQRGTRASIALVGQVLPALAIVYFLIFLFNTFADTNWIAKFVGQSSGIKGWAIALAGGVLSLGPIYPWYAILGELKEKGMQPSLIAAFLYARAVKPPLLPLLVYYFGVIFTISLVGFMLVFAVINGFLIRRLIQNNAMRKV